MNNDPIRVLIIGHSGRMGVILRDELLDRGHIFVQGIDDKNTAEIHEDVQVCLDFSIPGALNAYLPKLIERKIPVVCGTTGLSDEHLKEIDKASEHIPILLATNFSLGMNTLLFLVREAAAILKGQAEVEITETHHRYKKDAPSGTAITLATEVMKGMENVTKLMPGRKGTNLERMDEIGMHSLRGGTIFGEHNVHMFLDSEELIFTHRVGDRGVFGEGAVSVMPYIIGKEPGIYSIRDYLTEMIEE